MGEEVEAGARGPLIFLFSLLFFSTETSFPFFLLYGQALMAKIKDRSKRKAALTDRKSAAAQARMKNIASLAADDRVPKAKKRKGGGGAFLYFLHSCPAHWRFLFSTEDMFGADDADWAIYRKIVRTPTCSSFFTTPLFILFFRFRRIRQHLRPMKKKTWRNYRSSNRNC